jgi:putative MATE family efflux protein
MKYLKQNKGFYRGVISLMLPLIIQNFTTASMSLADTFMVGALGETELAAVSMANTPFFVLMLFSFGLQSGAGVLVAQYYGKGNMEAINRILGIGLYASAAVTSVFALLSFLFPWALMGILTNNGTLIGPGAAYARIVGFSFFFNSLSGLYCAVQRSMGNPRVGAVVLSGSGLLNVFLNYILIFGKLGFPQLGVAGAAIATLLSRIAEVLVLVPYAVRSRHLPLMPRQLFRPGRVIVSDFIKYSLPVVCNELLWSLAFSAYTVIIGHMPGSTPLLAAYTIAGNMDRLMSVGVFACGASAAVIVGREIGVGNQKELFGKSIALNFTALLFGLFSAAVVLAVRALAARQFIFPLVNMSDAAASIAMFMLLVIAIFLPLRAVNITNIVGVLRGGGDVRFAMLTDTLPMYLLCVPLAAFIGLVLQKDIRAVYLCICLDEFVKAVLLFSRLRSRRWINDVTREKL